jgi:hypothetical protein
VRTVLIILGGVILLGCCLAASRAAAGDAPDWIRTGTSVFIPLWLLAALVNMWVGVTRAGYTVAEEFPIFLVIFALPALAALLIRWKFT